jgi:hypothetical protein
MEATCPTCTFAFASRCRSDPGSCQEAVGGRQGCSTRRGQPVLHVVQDLLRRGRATIIVPRGAHQIVQRPVEVLSPRCVSMYSSEILADAASTSCWRSVIASAVRCGRSGGSVAWTIGGGWLSSRRGDDEYGCRLAVSPAQRGATAPARCPSVPRQRAGLPATTGPTRSGERVR